ncbi:MAG: hypothetical protein ACFFG0_14190 [Candidatus Thorarchaeota archaeon]
MAKDKASRITVLAVASSGTYTFTNLNVAVNSGIEELPEQVIVYNPGSVSIWVKLLDKSEGTDVTARTGTSVPPGGSFVFETEEDELPFYRIGIILASGSTSVNVEISSLNFVSSRI